MNTERTNTNAEPTQAPFVLLSSPRCGSTTLSECLSLHPGIDLGFEPFHPDGGSPFAAEGATSHTPLAALPEFDRAIDRLFERFDGFKHVLHQLSPILARRLLRRRPLRVILLRRENLLRQAVSNLLAFETSIWHAGDGPWPPPKLPRLDIERLAAMMAYYRDSQRIFASMLRHDNVDHRTLSYEGLFDRESWIARRRVLDELFIFLGRPPIDDEELLGALKRALDPAPNRLASTALYRRIPNWREIERRLGDASRGWSLTDPP